jgi:hypothetical protein
MDERKLIHVLMAGEAAIPAVIKALPCPWRSV